MISKTDKTFLYHIGGIGDNPLKNYENPVNRRISPRNFLDNARPIQY
ncbi:hypothetical protein D3OALGA1CA_5202 [Olavius algarvensis associated proteobacterium Delta 3]|nr:hypothetical protein D3OALGB2SA_2692 [Olavius algarvensis associated proteobacterium Delta 3]CAB5163334.1 hypothetical protein D3OALGA1CA_5202 [Olavius algarvensis associated proteobacterium Delta 3]